MQKIINFPKLGDVKCTPIPEAQITGRSLFNYNDADAKIFINVYPTAHKKYCVIEFAIYEFDKNYDQTFYLAKINQVNYGNNEHICIERS